MVQRQAADEARSGAAPGAVIVVFNLPVPDDHRVWAQACALRDAGLRVCVVCPSIRDAAPGRRRIEGIDVHCFRSFEGEGRVATVLEGAWTTFAAGRAAKRELVRIDGRRTLQVCNPPDLSFRLLRWARRRGVRTVYDQHDVVPLLAAARPSFRRLVAFFLACERRTVEAADAVLTPSSEQAARLSARYGRDAVVVRTAAVSEPEEGQRAEPDATGPGVAEAESVPAVEPTVLGYLGVIGEQDGVVDLVDAVQALRAAGRTGFRVEVAGDGPALPSVRARVAELGLGEVVQLRGWVGRDRIDAFLKGVDAMLVPDPESEFNHHCAMNKVTHAMARGIPVVLRPLRENARLTGRDGFLAGDMSLAAFVAAIERLLAATPAERAATGARLRAAFEAELSWTISGPRYLAVFQESRG
ncbi:MAG TPA: glycosyltransferase [Actinospica sp.]|nr:glycosyltransferase [Actinospica sp.]